jgi:hypothetical protein
MGMSTQPTPAFELCSRGPMVPLDKACDRQDSYRLSAMSFASAVQWTTDQAAACASSPRPSDWGVSVCPTPPHVRRCGTRPCGRFLTTVSADDPRMIRTSDSGAGGPRWRDGRPGRAPHSGIDLVDFGRVVEFAGDWPETPEVRELKRGSDGWRFGRARTARP